MASKALQDARSNAATDAYFKERITKVIMDGGTLTPPPGMNEAQSIAWERAVERHGETLAGSPQDADKLAQIRGTEIYQDAREKRDTEPRAFADAAREAATERRFTKRIGDNLGREEETESRLTAGASRADKEDRDKLQAKIDRDREIRASEDR